MALGKFSAIFTKHWPQNVRFRLHIAARPGLRPGFPPSHSHFCRPWPHFSPTAAQIGQFSAYFHVTLGPDMLDFRHFASKNWPPAVHFFGIWDQRSVRIGRGPSATRRSAAADLCRLAFHHQCHQWPTTVSDSLFQVLAITGSNCTIRKFPWTRGPHGRSTPGCGNAMRAWSSLYRPRHGL